ncbi:MAG: tetratricopeptide repeat protein [Magnetococcales bacterium]|nr:tetratricopeptide repeat protein [Magnetococcales bacterium]
MVISTTLTIFVILGFLATLGAIFFAWHRLNKKPMEAQDWKRNRAETLWKDAVDLQSKGSFAKALEKWQQSAFMESDSFHPRPGFLGQVHNELGYCYYRVGQFKESEEHFQKALALFRKTSFWATFDTAFTLNNYALLCMETGRHDQALVMIRRSMKIFSSGLGEKSPQIVHVLNNLARSYMQVGAYASALEILQRALDITAQSLLPHYPESLLAKELLAETHQQLGSIHEAEQLFLEVVSTKEALHGPEHSGVLPALHALARFYLAQGLVDQSLALHERILTIIRTRFHPEHHFVAEFLNEFACMKIKIHAPDEASRMVDEAMDIFIKADKSTHASMLINIYLKLWLQWHHSDDPWEMTLLQQAMILLQIPGNAELGSVVFHLAALFFDRRKAPASAIFFGKQAIHNLLNHKRTVGHGHTLPDWLIRPSEQPVWQDLGSMLRRADRILEAQALGISFPRGRPIISSLHEKIADYLKGGWQPTERERHWEEAWKTWEHHVAVVFHPKVETETAAPEKGIQPGDKKAAPKAPPPPKPGEIMKNKELMTPLWEELDRLFATWTD